MRHLLTAVPPASGGVVMATGIQSVALRLAGHTAVAELLMWLTLAAWAALALVLVARVTLQGGGVVSRGARSPATLTGVAGTCVLGVCMTQHGWGEAGVLMLIVGTLGCGGLQRTVWRHWRTPASGAGFLTTVSVESLAVLCGALASAYRAPWLVTAGGVLAIVGVGLYPVVLVRFDLGEVLTGHGDQWVAGGALAIAALACAQLALAARALAGAVPLADALRAAAPVLGLAAVAWLPILVAGEVRRPRLSYDVRRWGTVFPVAMYSAASLAVGRLAGVDLIVALARGWVWVALVIWAVVLGAMFAHGRRLLARR